eukprot:m.651957 g.651957  ORF g.651957 m.651957 type:complete len:910 (-) comp22685_c0_seq1:467-3196(-)
MNSAGTSSDTAGDKKHSSVAARLEVLLGNVRDGEGSFDEPSATSFVKNTISVFNDAVECGTPSEDGINDSNSETVCTSLFQQASCLGLLSTFRASHKCDELIIEAIKVALTSCNDFVKKIQNAGEISRSNSSAVMSALGGLHQKAVAALGAFAKTLEKRVAVDSGRKGGNHDIDVQVDQHRASVCKLLLEIGNIRGFAEPGIMNTTWKSISFIVRKYPTILKTALDVNALVQYILTELTKQYNKLKKADDLRDVKRSLTVVRFLIKHLQPLCATYTTRLDNELRRKMYTVLIDLYSWSDIDAGVVNTSETALAVAEHLPPMVAMCLRSLCASDAVFWETAVASHEVVSKDTSGNRGWMLALAIAVHHGAWPDASPAKALESLFLAVERCYAHLSSCSALVVDISAIASNADAKHRALCMSLYDRALACGQHILAQDASSVAVERVFVPHVIGARFFYTRQLAKDLWQYFAKYASNKLLLNQAMNLCTAAVGSHVDEVTRIHLCDVASSIMSVCTNAVKQEFWSTFRTIGERSLCGWSWLHIPSVVPVDQLDAYGLEIVNECILRWGDELKSAKQNHTKLRQFGVFPRVILNVLPHTTLGVREISFLNELMIDTFQALATVCEIDAQDASALLRLTGSLLSIQPPGAPAGPFVIANLVAFLNRTDSTLLQHAAIDLVTLQQNVCLLDGQFADAVRNVSSRLCTDFGREKWLLWTQCLQSFHTCMQSSDDDIARVLSGACTPTFMSEFKKWVQMDNQRPLPWERGSSARNAHAAAEVSRLQSVAQALRSRPERIRDTLENGPSSSKRRRIQGEEDQAPASDTASATSEGGTRRGGANGVDRTLAPSSADGPHAAHQGVVDALRDTVQQAIELHRTSPFTSEHMMEIHNMVDNLRTCVSHPRERSLSKFSSA